MLNLYLIETPYNMFANRADPNQAALVRAAWSGSALFAYGNMIYLIQHKWIWQVFLLNVPTWKFIYTIIHSGWTLAWIFMKEWVKEFYYIFRILTRKCLFWQKRMIHLIFVIIFAGNCNEYQAWVLWSLATDVTSPAESHRGVCHPAATAAGR